MGEKVRSGMVDTTRRVRVHTPYPAQRRRYARHLVPLQTMLGCSTN